jgi:hypothetical protein
VRHTGNAKTKLAGSVVWPARWCFTLLALEIIIVLKSRKHLILEGYTIYNIGVEEPAI